MSEAAATQTPKEIEDAYFANLQAVQDKQGAIGIMMIVGLDREDDDEDEDNENVEDKDKKPEKVTTKEELATLRYMVMTKDREKALDDIEDFATFGQKGDDFQMYNTHSGNMTILGIPKEVNKAMKKKSDPQKFDALFALTWWLKRVEVWIEDNELYDEGGECEDALKKLAAAWKKLLAKSNEELGTQSLRSLLFAILILSLLTPHRHRRRVHSPSGGGASGAVQSDGGGRHSTRALQVRLESQQGSEEEKDVK